MSRNIELPERFWSRIERGQDCWTWTGAHSDRGYGQIWDGIKVVYAHRFSYEVHYGPIPTGLQIDHRCRNRDCVNPRHLRLATAKQNAENLGLSPSNRSGVRGVHWHKKNQCWRAQITHNGSHIEVGSFASLEDAAEAIRVKRLELFTHNDEDRDVVPAM